MSSHKAQHARKFKKSKQQTRQSRGGVARNGVPKVVRSNTPYLMPERYSAKLTFASIINLNNAGFKDAIYILRPTSVYDVDPALGGASAYGLAEFAQFYERYKVHSSTISVDAGNLDNEPVTFFLTPSLTNPGNNPADVGPWFASTAMRKKALGAYSANSSATLRHSYSTQTLTGVDFFAEDGYASPVTTNPILNTYWVLGAVKGGPSNFVYGLTLVVKLTMVVHFYGLRPLASPAARIHRQTFDASYPPPMPVYLTNPPPPALTYSPTPVTTSQKDSVVQLAAPKV